MDDELIDILHTIIFTQEEISEECALDILESSFLLMDEYLNENPEIQESSHIKSILLNELVEFFQMDDIDDILEHAVQLYMVSFLNEREDDSSSSSDDSSDVSSDVSSYDEPEDTNDDDEEEKEKEEEEEKKKEKEEEKKSMNEALEKKIKYLKSLPQPVQRTPEWYQFRWNLITASNAWKAFGTQSSMNQLIYEKCQPLKDTEDVIPVAVNTSSPLHWGQKYEPLSVMIYEYTHNAKVSDFGCIQHPMYSFLGASPDGIVTSPNKYGTMLEIKNVVSREITGIPKNEYWIQMQLQMEVCDLDDCDFLETKFVEYDVNSFNTDSSSEFKGILMYFDKGGIPHYEYMPLNLHSDFDARTKWEEELLDRNADRYTFIKFIYWKLEKISCIYVKRDTHWFHTHIGQLQNIWNIIEKERQSGYEHRAPIRREAKAPAPYKRDVHNDQCFLQVIKS